jgi:predicted RNase H-like HicB family nuclease
LWTADGRPSGVRGILTVESCRSSALRRTTMATGNGGQTVRLPAVVTVERDDLGEVYVARCLAVEVASHGDTQEQALANLREALELYFEDSPVPEVDVNPELASVDVRVPA